jgi:hypothetical protein
MDVDDIWLYLWLWNLLMKIYVIELWYIGLRIVMINWLMIFGCIYDYEIVDKNICDWVVRYWIENCDDKFILICLKLLRVEYYEVGLMVLLVWDYVLNVILLWNVVCVERKMFGNTCVIIWIWCEYFGIMRTR